MNSIRIHKDITIRWTVKTNGSAVSLIGRDLKLFLIHMSGAAVELPFTVTASEPTKIVSVYYGKDQTLLGQYSLMLIENEGKVGETALDHKAAFNLVPTTYLEKSDPVTGLDAAAAISLQDSLASTGRGESAYEVAVRNGYSGTETQWLASLKGETGATGATGATGPKGDTGPSGFPYRQIVVGDIEGEGFPIVRYDEQSLTSSEKSQARSNIGAASSADLSTKANDNEVVKITDQSLQLSDTEKATARNNIDACIGSMQLLETITLEEDASVVYLSPIDAKQFRIEIYCPSANGSNGFRSMIDAKAASSNTFTQIATDSGNDANLKTGSWFVVWDISNYEGKIYHQRVQSKYWKYGQSTFSGMASYVNYVTPLVLRLSFPSDALASGSVIKVFKLR